MVYTYGLYTSKTISLIQLSSVLSCNKHILWNVSRIQVISWAICQQSINYKRTLDCSLLSHLKSTFRKHQTKNQHWGIVYKKMENWCKVCRLFSIYVDFHVGYNRKKIRKIHCLAITHRILLNLLLPCVLSWNVTYRCWLNWTKARTFRHYD